MKIKSKLIINVFLLSLIAIVIILGYTSFSKMNEIRSKDQQVQSDLSILNKDIAEKDMRIDQLGIQIKELNDKFIDLNKKVESYENTQYSYNSVTNQNETSLRNLMKIINNLPQVSHKLAFIKDELVSDSDIKISLDYVEWFSLEEAEIAAKEDNNEDAGSLSNGFYIRNKEIENHEVRIRNDTIIYALEGASLKFVEMRSLIEKNDSLKDRLFNVYSVNNKLLILEEQYRP